MYAFAHTKRMLDQLSFLWGVHPVSTIEVLQASKMISTMLLELDRSGELNRHGLYITTIGYPAGVPGSTNTIKILNESEIEYYMNLE